MMAPGMVYGSARGGGKVKKHYVRAYHTAKGFRRGSYASGQLHSNTQPYHKLVALANRTGRALTVAKALRGLVGKRRVQKASQPRRSSRRRK